MCLWQNQEGARRYSVVSEFDNIRRRINDAVRDPPSYLITPRSISSFASCCCCCRSLRYDCVQNAFVVLVSAGAGTAGEQTDSPSGEGGRHGVAKVITRHTRRTCSANQERPEKEVKWPNTETLHPQTGSPSRVSACLSSASPPQRPYSSRKQPTSVK